MCFKSNLLVALAAFWVNFCILGVLRSNAVIFSGLVDVFGINRQHAAWPSGMFGFFMSVTGAITGFLTNYWSIRSLAIFGTTLAALSVSICSFAYQMKLIILFYGALQGIGIGLIVPLTHVVLNQNFSKYKAFAMGIAYSGSSAGSFVFPPISKYILNAYDLDGTFLILGGIMLNALIGTMFFKTPKRYDVDFTHDNRKIKESPIETVYRSKLESGKVGETAAVEITKCDKKHGSVKQVIDVGSAGHNAERSEQDDCSQKTSSSARRGCGDFCNRKILASAFEILTSPKFLIISFAYASYFTSSAIFLMVVLDFAKDRGLEEHKSVFLVSAFSFGDLAGRLTCGWVADLKVIQRGTLVRLYLITMGTLLVLLPVVPSNALTSIAVALGVINGGVIVNYSVLLNEYLGIEKLPMTMGFSTCMVGMSAFLRPIIIGFFRDYHESYDLLFVFLGLLQISIATMWFFEAIIPVVQQFFSVNKIVK